MIRNLKALGLAAFAVLAMGALFASGAQAQGGIFTAGETDPFTHTHTEIRAEQYGEENYFEVGESRIECEIGTKFGTDGDGTFLSLILSGHFTDCSAAGLPMTITMNGCQYVLNQPEQVAETETTWTGTVDLVCPEGKTVDIEVYLFGGVTSHSFKVCTETVEPAENLGHIIFHQRTDREVTPDVFKDDLTATVTITGTAIVEDNQACSPGEQTIPNTTEGDYVSSMTIWAETKGAEDPHHDLWISEEGG